MADFVIDTWFPSSIYKAQEILSPAENAKILSRVLQLENMIESGGKSWKSNTFNSRNTYAFQADPDFQPVIQEVTRRVAQYAQAFNSAHRYECTSAWFNVAREHSYQEFHIHPNNVFSAIYYVACPEGSGDVVFERGEADMMPVKGIQALNALTYTSCNYAPAEGLLLIFRSSLRHMVRIGTNKSPRVSLAFNFS